MQRPIKQRSLRVGGVYNAPAGKRSILPFVFCHQIVSGEGGGGQKRHEW